MSKFITLEGIEGVGKTSNLRFIETLLREAGHDCVVTREPGGTELGEALRELLLQHREPPMSANTELLLMFAARAEHLDKLVLPALGQNKMVLCDRFTEATYAYQGCGRELGEDRIARLEDWVQGDLRPDLTIVLDAPVAVGRSRAGRRSAPDRIEKEQDDFFERVRNGYRRMAERYPQRIALVDASLPLAQVQTQIKRVLLDYEILQ